MSERPIKLSADVLNLEQGRVMVIPAPPCYRHVHDRPQEEEDRDGHQQPSHVGIVTREAGEWTADAVST